MILCLLGYTCVAGSTVQSESNRMEQLVGTITVEHSVPTHVSAKVPLTNAWVNEVFPTARKPRMATLRCTMAGSFFGIVQTKVCYHTPTKAITCAT